MGRQRERADQKLLREGREHRREVAGGIPVLHPLPSHQGGNRQNRVHYEVERKDKEEAGRRQGRHLL